MWSSSIKDRAFWHGIKCLHSMMTSSNICAGNSPIPGEFLAQRPVTRSFDVFFDLCLNKRSSKQSWVWWFGTLSRPLWRHCNAYSAVRAWRNRKFCATSRRCAFGLIVSYRINPYQKRHLDSNAVGTVITRSNLNVLERRLWKKTREIHSFSMTFSLDDFLCLEGNLHKRCILTPKVILS